ncbi:hypothetical protein [Pararhodospirillum photometricum]|nr:hypothetical protein [Pararhodospirillum photometricum]
MLTMEVCVRADFHTAIARATASAERCDGWLAGHTLYSNVRAVLLVHLPGPALPKLAATLAADGFVLTSEPPLAVNADDVVLSLAVTALHEGPDLRRDVPAFG